MINKEELNKKFDEYIERPFVILDFVIFLALILPMFFSFSENILKFFHIIDVTIWLLILLEVTFKLWVVPSKIYYLIHDWEDVICALLPILPNFKIVYELSHLHIKQGLKLVRAAAFVKRIAKKLELIFGINEKQKT
ncbi:hypothetical protein HGB13_02240 [bacterium]|nr:hypothetical protein [bacterium]